jgi:hypothetical protein
VVPLDELCEKMTSYMWGASCTKELVFEDAPSSHLGSPHQNQPGLSIFEHLYLGQNTLFLDTKLTVVFAFSRRILISTVKVVNL